MVFDRQVKLCLNRSGMDVSWSVQHVLQNYQYLYMVYLQNVVIFSYFLPDTK